MKFICNTNGNMITDLDRDIVTIKYNLLNLPELIQFKNGNQIKNLYDAIGKKLSSRYVTLVPGIFNPLNPGQVIDGLDVNENDFVTIEGMDYINNIEYKVSRIFDWDVSFEPKDNISIKRVHNGEGYAEGVTYVTEGNEPAYSYYRRDHLGNNREVWCASYIRNNSVRPGKTMQRTQYYPSGLPWAESTGASVQQRKYNGKEFVGTHGLDEYDSHARWYYPAIQRTTTMDPLAEKYYSISPYVYCLNNPIKFIDPDGRAVVAADINARRNITNTLSREEVQYVKFDNKGMLDVSLLNQYNGSSENFTALHALANSETNYIFAVSNNDINGSKFFEKGSNPKNPNNFSYGVTNLPGAENDPSPDNNVYIFTASFLDEKTQARNTAHEGYGHAYFFELSKSDPSINPNHTKGVVGTSSEYDSDLKKNVPYFIFGNTNTKLEEQIKKVEQQAIQNYEDKNP